MSSCNVLRSCSRKSMTKKTSLRVSPTTTSLRSTIWRCCRDSFSVWISRRAVTGKPSFRLSIFNFFSATISPVAVSRARDTQPYEPSSMWFSLSKLSTRRQGPHSGAAKRRSRRGFSCCPLLSSPSPDGDTLRLLAGRSWSAAAASCSALRRSSA